MPLERIGCALLASKLSYGGGDFDAYLAIVNQSLHDLVLHFSTTQRFDFALRTPNGAEYWRWSTGQTFSPTEGGITVKPGSFHVLDVHLLALPLPSAAEAHVLLDGELMTDDMPSRGRMKIILT